MDIHEVKGIGPATVKKLQNAGVNNLDDLRNMDVDQVAKRTGIQNRRLNEWRLEARMIKVLEDVKGIGPAAKRKLQKADIHSVEDLARASIHELAHQTSIAKERAKKWQQDARRLLKQTEAELSRKQAALKQRGGQAVKQSREQAATATKKGRKIAKTTKERTTKAARQGRKRADELATEVRDRVDEWNQRRTPEPAPPAPESEPGSAAQRVAVGTNGQNGSQTHGKGLFGRLKRVFQAR